MSACAQSDWPGRFPCDGLLIRSCPRTRPSSISGAMLSIAQDPSDGLLPPVFEGFRSCAGDSAQADPGFPDSTGVALR